MGGFNMFGGGIPSSLRKLIGIVSSASEIDEGMAKGWIPRKIPSEIDASPIPNLKIWKIPNERRFVTNVKAKRVVEDADCDKIYYVDIETGSDTNDGLSILTPFKTIAKPLSINFIYKVTIYIKGGTYVDSLGWYGASGAASLTHLNVIGYDGQVISTSSSLALSNGIVRCGVRLYCENISFIGGKIPFSFSKILDKYTRASFKNCKFNNSLSNNGFEVITNGLYIMENCEASGNIKDGFNYHGALDSTLDTLVIEINCKGFTNGKNSEGTNNGSTAHESVRIIRINGEYYNNQNRNIHDVGNARSWNLGCYAYDNQGTDANFVVGISDTDSTIMWLDTCRSGGLTNKDFRYFSSSHTTAFLYAYDYKKECGIPTTDTTIYYDVEEY